MISLQDKEALDSLKQNAEKAFKLDDLFNESRKDIYIIARSSFYSYARNKLNLTYQKLSFYSKKNHATIINSINRFETYYKYYSFKSEIDFFVSECGK